jgi:hypothetical protein
MHSETENYIFDIIKTLEIPRINRPMVGYYNNIHRNCCEEIYCTSYFDEDPNDFKKLFDGNASGIAKCGKIYLKY